jgi:phosphatidylinositol-3-phosphatase
MENKSYASVIGTPGAPYETQLAHRCASDTHWSDVGSQYDSLPNYIAMTTGQSGSILAPFTCDCAPSPSVSVTVDNIFRQVRAAGGTERSYAEGMSGNCSDSGGAYAPKHNPALYMWGGADRSACQRDDIPLGSATAGNFINALKSNTLPTYSLVAPNLCHDTHDCGVPAGDQFLKTLLPHIFSSQAYRSGKTAMFVVWDEDSYIPNIVVAPSVIPGTAATTAVNHYGLLRATEEMLGLPLLGNAAGATSLRTVFHI